MEDGNGFHMTIVTQRRRSQPSAPSEEPGTGTPHHSDYPAGDGPGAHHSRHSEEHSAHHSQHSEHRRHYHDYGSVSLGSMDDAQTHDAPAAPREIASQGQAQREFYSKYNDVLNRKYTTRNKPKMMRVLMIIVLLLLVLVLSILGLGNLGQEGAEAPAAPPVVTVPQVTLDLG